MSIILFVEHEKKVIQKGGIAHHVYVFILCAPHFHVLFDMLESSGKTGSMTLCFSIFQLFVM